MKRVTLLTCLTCLVWILAACSSNQPKVVVEKSVTPAATQDPTKGSVRAVIQYGSGSSILPYKEMNFYLAPIVSDSTGQYQVAGLDITTAPYSSTDEKGVIIFPNVTPGKYALILNLVLRGFLFNQPDNEENPLVIEVTKGKVTDIGTLVYPTVPATPTP